MSNTNDSALEKDFPASAEGSEFEAVNKEIAVSDKDGKSEEQRFAWNPGDTTDYSDEEEADDDSDKMEEAIRRCGSDIDSEDFEDITEEVDTLAGLILELKGDFPKLNEEITYKNYKFKIVAMNARRILKVKFNIILNSRE